MQSNTGLENVSPKHLTTCCHRCLNRPARNLSVSAFCCRSQLRMHPSSTRAPALHNSAQTVFVFESIRSGFAMVLKSGERPSRSLQFTSALASTSAPRAPKFALRIASTTGEAPLIGVRACMSCPCTYRSQHAPQFWSKSGVGFVQMVCNTDHLCSGSETACKNLDS